MNSKNGNKKNISNQSGISKGINKLYARLRSNSKKIYQIPPASCALTPTLKTTKISTYLSFVKLPFTFLKLKFHVDKSHIKYIYIYIYLKKKNNNNKSNWYVPDPVGIDCLSPKEIPATKKMAIKITLK